MKKHFVIMFLLLFILSGCKKKEEVKVEPKKEEIRELSEAEIDTLLKRIDDLSYFDINPAKSFKVSDLTNQEVLLWATSKEDVLNISFADMEKKAADYLDFSLEPDNILCMTHSNVLGTSDYLYLYNVEHKNFIKNVGHREHSNEGYYSYVVNRYDSSKFENDNYIISVYKMFSDTNAKYDVASDITWKRNWYASYLDAKNKNNSLEYDTLEGVKYDINQIDTSKLIKYTYTFKMKNDNFILKTYEIEKK